MTLRGAQTIVVERRAGKIVVRAEVVERFERLHLTAAVRVDGRLFYHRSWDLDVRGVPWNLRTAPSAVDAPADPT